MDKIKIARCLESQVDTFIHTLNDYTLLLATDTTNLYSRVNGVKTLLNPRDPVIKQNNDDGFYLQSDTNGEPLFKTNIEFNEITEDQQHVLDRLNKLDNEANEIMFMDGDKEVFNKVLQYDINTDKITIVDKI